MADDSPPFVTPRAHDTFAHPRVSGGDGSSLDQAVKIDSTGLDMALMLMQLYLEQAYGVKGREWLPVTEQWVDSVNHAPRTVRVIEMELGDGSQTRCYFHLGLAAALEPARSLGAAALMPPQQGAAPAQPGGGDAEEETAPSHSVAPPPPLPFQNSSSTPLPVAYPAASILTSVEKSPRDTGAQHGEGRAGRLAWLLTLLVLTGVGAAGMHFWLSSDQGMRTLSVGDLGDSIRAEGKETLAATASAPKEDDTSAALASASETASPASGSESESAPGQVTRTPEAAQTAAPRTASVGELRQPTAETPSPASLGPTAEPRSAAPLTDAEMQVRFLNVVRDWGEALVQGDYAKLVGCMPADYVKSVGGAEELAKQLTVVMKMFRASGLKIRDFLVGEVSPVSVEKNALAVLVPTFLGTDLKDYPKGGTLRGYLVGVSYDKGLSWKVVDNEVAPPSEVRRLMPELAGMTEVPVPGNSLMEDLNASVTAIEKREGRPIREYIQELMKKGEADSPAPSRQSAGQVASSSREEKLPKGQVIRWKLSSAGRPMLGM